MAINQEQLRMQEAREGRVAWRKWGPYLSERQWGTVREDYSSYGDAWGYFPHDQARSRAYRWGEDGIAGISAIEQQLCFALALWNGADPILKERLFGLTNSEGNHGEDVKEYYFYLDTTPTHSYMKYLYKYPQADVSLCRLGRENRRRATVTTRNTNCSIPVCSTKIAISTSSSNTPKPAPKTSSSGITVVNRGPEAAPLAPACRRSGSATPGPGAADGVKPALRQERCGAPDDGELRSIRHWVNATCTADGAAAFLFTENETNQQRLLWRCRDESPYVKDGINDYIVHGRQGTGREPGSGGHQGCRALPAGRSAPGRP